MQLACARIARLYHSSPSTLSAWKAPAPARAGENPAPAIDADGRG
jgi:hypothetical protein